MGENIFLQRIHVGSVIEFDKESVVPRNWINACYRQGLNRRKIQTRFPEKLMSSWYVQFVLMCSDAYFSGHISLLWSIWRYSPGRTMVAADDYTSVVPELFKLPVYHPGRDRTARHHNKWIVWRVRFLVMLLSNGKRSLLSPAGVHRKLMQC